jgi:hypothetical protein
MSTVPAQDRLGGHVKDLLTLAIAGLADIGEVPVAYVSPDVPSLDFLGTGPAPCSETMLAAYVANVAREPTIPAGQLNSEQAHRFAWLNMAQVTFTYARCIRGLQARGSSPSPEAQTDDALAAARAGWAIYNAMNWGIRHGLALSTCGQFRMGQLVPISGGGAAGYTLTVGFQIDGYDPFESAAARHLVGVSDTVPVQGG